MPGMTTLPTVLDTVPDLSANEFEVGYITGDGTRHRVPFADVRAVPLEVMAPIRRFNARRVSGICRGAGGRPPMTGTWVTSRGWSVTT
jgi:hypothetical protein